MLFLCVQHVSAARVLAMDAASVAKQIKVAAGTSSTKPCLWMQFSSVCVMQAAAICCSSMRSRKKRNLFVRITNGLFSDEYGNQYEKPTHGRWFVNENWYFLLLFYDVFTQSPSHFCRNVHRDCCTREWRDFVFCSGYVLLLCARLSFGVWTFLRHQLTWLQMTCGFYWDIYRSRRQTNSASLLGLDVPILFYNQVFCCEQSTTDKSLSFQPAEIVSSTLACQPRCLNFWTLYIVSVPYSASPTHQDHLS